MKTFKQHLAEAKETEWTKNLSDKDMKTHLENVKAKGIWNSILKHEAFSDYHSALPTGSKTAFQHMIDADGHHHVRLASTGNPNEHLHFIASSRGKVFTVNHNKVETDSEENKVRTLLKRYEKN